MKKFISLVLALVMALSLTTVAWGALTAGTLPAAVSGTITLTEDVTFSGQNAADQLSDYVIDLNDKTMTLSGNTYLTGETTIKNGNIVVSGAISDSYLCLYDASTKLTLEDVNLTGTFDAYAVLNGAAGSTLVIKNSVIDVQGNITNPDSMGNIIYGGNVTVDNSTIKGKNTVRGIGLSNVTIQNNSTVEISDVETGLNNSTVTVDDSTVTITNATKRAVRLNNNTLTLQNGATLAATNCAEDVIGIGTTDTVSVSSDSTLNAVDKVTPVYVAQVGSTKYETLTEAMKAVTSGATLTLLDDVTISEAWDCRYNGAKFLVPVTIDGDGHKLTFTGKVDDKNWNTVFRFEEPATVKNLTIDASAATGIQRGISAKLSITVENFTFIGNGTTARYGVIFGEGAGAAISNVTATVTGSTFENTSYGVSDNRNGQDAKSVTVTDSTFTNAAVLLSASESVTFNDNTVEGKGVSITSYSSTNELAVTATGNTLDADEDNEIVAATITTDTNDFATTGTLTAPAGYTVVNGKVVAKSSLRGNTTTYDVKDLTITTPTGTKEDTSAITGITKYAASTNTTTVNGKTTTTVVPAWFLLSEGAYNYTFVECDKSCADFLFTIKGVGSFYVRAMDVPTAFDATPVALYTAPLKATCNMVGANEDVYVLVDGKYYPTKNVVVESYGLLNGKMVVFDKTQAGTPTPHDWNNVTAASYNSATGKLTAVKCPVCKGTVAVYEKPGSFDGKEYKLVGGTGIASAYYYVVGAVATTPAGTAGATVESAETFDAGIAMYVGMSVMAAAGSAVVLKKKD